LSAAQSAAGGALPSMAVRYEDMTARPSGAMVARQILKGLTHSAVELDLHETELAPGQAPHAPHQHVHEELLLICEGHLEVTIDGRATRLGAGSVAYLASNHVHGWRNVGVTLARYFVLAIGSDNA
jgi:quercetin dioxygenase-like cupin family protein